jgi:flagellin
MSINTNIASLNAQRNVGKVQNSLNTSLKRLSSGLRINSAKDDAAGLAISNRFTAQIRGLGQAARNANDAISLAQTAEGALDESTNILQRMRELAVQSRNDTNTTADRESLDNEFQELKAELDRIATTTTFNGRNVLDGSMGTATFQVGANVGETIDVSVSTSMRTNAVGGYASVSYTLANDVDDATGDDFSLDAADDWVINGTNVGAATDGTYGRGDGSAYAIATQINTGTDTHGVTAEAGTTSLTVTAAEIGNFAFTNNDNAADLTYTLTVNDQQVFVQTELATPYSAAQMASQINGFQSTTGVVATVQGNGDMILTSADGRNIEIQEVLGGGDNAADQAVGYFGNTVTNAAATNVDVTKTDITLSADQSITLSVGGGADALLGVGPAPGASATTDVATIEASDILTAAASDLSINRVDIALSEVAVFRSTLGAVQNRFESTISNLDNIAENLSAANSRIVDADFAKETAQLAKSQILQQAGVAMLAQANQLPQAVLGLIQ